jgi:hypothetical protein
MSTEVVCGDCGVMIERYEDSEPYEEHLEQCRVCKGRALNAFEAGWAEYVALAIEPPDNRVSCIICGVRRHPANMVNAYEGEYMCQECRWGL